MLDDSKAARHVSGTGMWSAKVRAQPNAASARIAVVLHLYYPELWEEFAAAIRLIGEPCDVYVSCPLRARVAVTRMVRARFPSAQVAGVHNVGRDVLPFLAWLATPGIDRYAYVLKLHSKKSVHIVDPALTPAGGGEAWRRRSLEGLLPDARRIAILLDALDARTDVGIVAPAGLLYDQIQWRCATGDLMATLCRRIGIPGTVSGGFPAGTMFWARVSAFAPLMRLSQAALEFDREAAQTDGTLHHAYERLFSLVAAAEGYRTVDSAELFA
jgi:lipopolysaccharide biosynthesis protein